MAITLDIADLLRVTSLSTFLSPGGEQSHSNEIYLRLTHKNVQLDSVHLVLLALNEECRNIGRGAFYHLPLRTNEPDAHPCDVVYLPDIWSKHDTSSWDQASWNERLNMCKIAGIEVNEDVIPICIRILKLDDNSNDAYNKSHSASSSFSSSPVLSINESMSSTMSEDAVSNTPTIQFDPSIKPNIYRYSRPMEDISTLLIIYTSHHSTPTVCLTAAFEHESLSTRSATPGDFSETFEYGPMTKGHLSTVSNPTTGGSPDAQQKIASMAAKRVMSSGMASNRDLVEHLWDLWHDDFNDKGTLEKDWLGKTKYSWQEVQSIIDGGGIGSQDLPYGWPVSE